MSTRPRFGRLGGALLVMLCVAAATAPKALPAPIAVTSRSGTAVIAPDAAIGVLPLPAVSLGGLANSLTDPTSLGGLNPLNSLSSGITGFALGALGSWVLNGAQAALQETANVIDQTTAPRLESTWFSSTYWRVVSLAALLTLPFLFAAAVQALLRSDLTLLLRAALGYLPLAMIGVSLAAPITLMFLSVTDEMCSVVAGAGTGGGVHFLRQTATEIAGLSALGGSPFLGFAIGLMTLAAAIALAIEMLIREAAVYVVVLMLPLAFAALVWPARRTWAVRLMELLIALILSKFVIVAVLSLAGAAYGSSGSPSVTRLLTAMALVMLSTFSPWVMLRLLPFTELAAGAAGAIRAEVPRWGAVPMNAMEAADGAMAWAEKLSQRLRSPSPGKSDVSDTGGSASGGAQLDRARYAPTDPGAGSISSLASDAPGDEQTTSRTGESSDTGPRERLPGLAPEWQGENGTISVTLGRRGNGIASQEMPAMADEASAQGSGGRLTPDVDAKLSPDPGRDWSREDTISRPPPTGGDEPATAPFETPDDDRL